jgi:transposase
VSDNLRAHYDPESRTIINRAGAELVYLTAYSPDLNPIEKMWSKVKEILRSIGARTKEDLIEAIRIALEAVSDKDAKGWFKSCGYTTTHL